MDLFILLNAHLHFTMRHSLLVCFLICFTMKIRSWVWSCGPTVFRERSWGTVLRMKHSRQKWTGYLMFDAAIRPSFVARLRLSPRLGRIFFKKQTSNQLNAQLVIAIYGFYSVLHFTNHSTENSTISS